MSKVTDQSSSKAALMQRALSLFTAFRCGEDKSVDWETANEVACEAVQAWDNSGDNADEWVATVQLAMCLPQEMPARSPRAFAWFMSQGVRP